MQETAYIKTPLGFAKIIGDKNGICNLLIVEKEKEELKIPTILQEAVDQLNEYFIGKRTVFTFKINFNGTNFQKKVWNELAKIPFGKTISYMDLAKKMGDMKAVRAVASANGKNPIWIAIPCHRVIGSDGSLTGYAGGLWRKNWLLEHENPTIQQKLF